MLIIPMSQMSTFWSQLASLSFESVQNICHQRLALVSYIATVQSTAYMPRLNTTAAIHAAGLWYNISWVRQHTVAISRQRI